MTDEVAIIGAGLSGLTLALALHQQHIKATVYESRAASLNIGGAVMLSPNGLKVLDALGVYEDVRTKGFNFDDLEIQKVDGQVVETYEFGSEAQYGYSANRIYRYELIDILLSKVNAEHIPIVFGHKFACVIEETAEGVIWETVEGDRFTSSILVGADGIHSTVRRYIYPSLIPKFTNMAGISAKVPSASVKHLGKPIIKPLTIVAGGVGAFIVAPQKIDGSELFIGRQIRMEKDLSREGWNDFLADKKTLKSFLQENAGAFGKVAVSATQLIQDDKIYVWPFYAIPQLENWASSQRRVILLGDAAHAIPPSAGQGINQAFEDVYSFSLVLAAVRSRKVDLKAALKLWQGYRQDRINQVLELNRQVDMRRLPQGQSIGNNKDNVVQQEFDLRWLYQVDCRLDVESWFDKL